MWVVPFIAIIVFVLTISNLVRAKTACGTVIGISEKYIFFAMDDGSELTMEKIKGYSIGERVVITYKDEILCIQKGAP